jgi:hypothetical protein
VGLTLPKSLRLRLARDPAWTSWVGNLVVRATTLVMPPVAFLRRLCGIIPPPPRHLVRYSGVFGPAAQHRNKLRALVPVHDVPEPERCASDAPRTRRLPCADLLRRVFADDVLHCPAVGVAA